MRTQSVIIVCCALLDLSSASAAPLGTAFTYQGKLADAGTPANGQYELKCALFDDAGGGAQVGATLTNSATGVSNGLFTVTLDFGADVFAGEARWLEIGVRTNGAAAFTMLVPRQELTPAPYAQFSPQAGAAATASTVPWTGLTDLPAGLADGVDNDTTYSAGAGLALSGTIFSLDAAFTDVRYWRLAGNAGTLPGTHFIGTTDNQPLEFKINGLRALRLEPAAESPNVIVGYPANAVTAGINGATIGGGGNLTEPNLVMSPFGTVSGGVGNVISTDSGDTTIGGGWLNVIRPSSVYATVGGGSHNTAAAISATVAGGFGNEALGQDSVVGGGYTNAAISPGSVVAGGSRNRVESGYQGGFIGGGAGNQVAAINSSVVGGYENRILDLFDGFIGGGLQNQISANHTVIGGGLYNTNAGPGATIGGGNHNRVMAGANDAFIGGGIDNVVEGLRSVVGGGERNAIRTNSTYAIIAGGNFNEIGTNSPYSTIGGGHYNTIAANATNATVAGGVNNDISSHEATIGGGDNNTILADSRSATIAGGQVNEIGTNAPLCTIGGGLNNQIASDLTYGTIAGGMYNSLGSNANSSAIGGGQENEIGADSWNATVAGGYRNTIDADSPYATIAGGSDNSIGAYSGYSLISGGDNNEIGTTSLHSVIAGGSYNTITNGASYAMILGGYQSFATNYAFAAGRRAKARHQGAFVWGDSSNAEISSTSANSVTMRAIGGYRLFSNLGATMGVSLAAGGNAWSPMSDRNVKENLRPVDPRVILDRVAALPVTEWNLVSQDPSIRHLGPMAQDFKAAFGLGEDDRHISTSDADGVALAAIQGLNEKLEDRSRRSEARTQQLEEKLQEREKEIAELKQAVTDLKRMVQQLAR